MKWISFAAGIALAAIGMLAFPSTSAVGTGTLSLGMMLLCEGGWGDVIANLSRSEEIEADFYKIRHAKWRYLLAVVTACCMALVFQFSRSFGLQVTAMVGGPALYVAFSFVATLRSRKRLVALGQLSP